MSDFKAEMHQIRFLLGLRPGPRRGSLQRCPDPLALFKGPTSEGREGKGRIREGGGKGKARIGRGREEMVAPQLGSLDPPVMLTRT